jgi:hypothetical protein
LDGTVHPLDLVVDTASADAFVLRMSVFEQLMWSPNRSTATTWGFMLGGWLRLYMPASGLVELIAGYGNNMLAAGVAAEDPQFMGLVGMPFLRLGEFGGNADALWFRYPPT